MSLEIPTWDKITGALASTTSQIGGSWANLISDYFNSIDIGLIDPSKKPIIGTLTRYKFEKFGLFDTDQSHYISFSVDDIDSGSNRKIKFRRMLAPYTEDYAVLEGLAQPILNKNIDFDLNTGSNIDNDNIKADAQIATSKLADSSNFAMKNTANVFTAMQSIEGNLDPSLELYKTANTGNIGVDFYAQSSTSTKRRYGAIDVTIATNTDGDEDSYITIGVIKDGTLGTRFLFNHNGNFFLRTGTSGPYGIVSPSAITSTDKVFTLPDITGTGLTDNSTATLSNKTINDLSNPALVVRSSHRTFTIFQSGSNYYARNNVTGLVTSFANTDISPVLEFASNNIKATGPTNNSIFLGSIGVSKGDYNLITECNLNRTDAGDRHGLLIEGEGPGTTINMNPVGTLNKGINALMAGFTLRDLRIQANANVTHLLYLDGSGSGIRRNDYQGLYNVYFEGPNSNAGHVSGAPIAGQKGVYFDGVDPALFFNTVFDCKFISLDVGVEQNTNFTTSVNYIANKIITCNEGIIIDGSGQNNITGLWVQGTEAYGTYGVHVKGGGHNQIDGVITEMHKTDNGTSGGNPVECAGVKIDNGVGNTQVGFVNNSYRSTNPTLWHAVLDSNPVTTTSNHHSGNYRHNGDTYFRAGSNVMTMQTSLAVPTGKLLLGDTVASNNLIFKVAGALGTSRDITWPAVGANDIPLLQAHAQPMTNKTIDFSQNTGTNIGDSAITAHTSTKISITAKGQLNSSIAYTDQANIFGNFSQFFRSATLKVLNPAQTFSYAFVGAAISATRLMNLPLLAADDEIAFLNHTQTFTNKTFDADGTGNSITNIENADIKAAANIAVSKLASGTALYSLQTNSGGTSPVWRAKTPVVSGVKDVSRKSNLGAANTYVDLMNRDVLGGTDWGTATFSINTTGADKYAVEIQFRKAGAAGTLDLRLVNNVNGTDVFHEFTNLGDGRVVSTMASLPAWCSGANEGVHVLRLQGRSTTSTDDVRCFLTVVRLT